MTDGTGSTAPEAQYIAVQNLPYELVPGCAKTFRKHLLTTERLEVQQTLIQGGGIRKIAASARRTGPRMCWLAASS